MRTVNQALKQCLVPTITKIATGRKECEDKHNPAAEKECNAKVVEAATREEEYCKAGGLTLPSAQIIQIQAAKANGKLAKINDGQPTKVTVLDPSVDEKDKTTVAEKFTKPVEKLVASETKLAELKTKYADTLKTFKEQMENMDIKGAQATLVTLRSLVSDIQNTSISMQTTMRDLITMSNQYDFPGEDILMRKARQSSSNIKNEGLALFKQYDKLFTSGIMKASTPFELTAAYGKFKAGE